MSNSPKPSSKLYGVTHDPSSGEPRIVEPKTVKVGIGLARGRAMHVYIDLERNWVIQAGYGQSATRERFIDRHKAQMRYRELSRTAPERKYPERLPYFTFSHLAGNGDFEPDWDVVEGHGPIPTEIDIIFIRDDPFSASYQMWGATEKKCDGDGKVALRVNTLAQSKEEKALATQSETAGSKYYPIMNGCWLSGCQYSKPSNDRPAACRPMGRLLFQLLNSPRLGGTAVFNTAGYKSISQLFSSIEIFKRATGGGDPLKGFVAGIPLKMVLRPYRTSHAGKSTTQYAVSLEFRAESALAMKRSLVEHAVQYRVAGAEPLKQLEGIVAHPPTNSDIDDNPSAIAAEFDPVIESEIDPHAAEVIPGHEDFTGGPVGALEHAWDSDPLVDVGTAPMSIPEQSPRCSDGEIEVFYNLCRRRGMTDTNILDLIGSEGFERIEEITVKAMPDLNTRASRWMPSGQGSLL